MASNGLDESSINLRGEPRRRKGLRAAWAELGWQWQVAVVLATFAGAVWGARAGWDSLLASKASAIEVDRNEAAHAEIHRVHDDAINSIDRRTVRLETTVDLVQQDVRRIADRMSIPAPTPQPHPTVTPGRVP